MKIDLNKKYFIDLIERLKIIGILVRQDKLDKEFIFLKMSELLGMLEAGKILIEEEKKD